MISRQVRFASIGFIMALFMAAVPARVDAAGPGADAEQFISSLADEAIKALTQPDSTPETRSQRFRVLLKENFDVKTIARWVLGRYWKKASKVEQAEYLKLFEELLIVTYVDRFSKYSGEHLKVSKSSPSGERDFVVFSRIVRLESTAPLNVDWRVRKKSTGFKIIDVMVEGVSMGQTQRSEFASVISRNGGEVKGLIAKLRDRN